MIVTDLKKDKDDYSFHSICLHQITYFQATVYKNDSLLGIQMCLCV